MIKNKPIFKFSSFLKEEFSEKNNISQMLLDKVMDILSSNNITIKRKRVNLDGFDIKASQPNQDPSADPYSWNVEFIFDPTKNMSKIGLVCHDWMKIEREKQILVNSNNLDSFEDEVQMLIREIEHDKQLLREHDFILPVQEIINDIIIQEPSHSFLGKKTWQVDYKLMPNSTMHCYVLENGNRVIFDIFVTHVLVIQSLQETFEESSSEDSEDWEQDFMDEETAGIFVSDETPRRFREVLSDYFTNMQREFVAGRVSQADLGIS
jgi:hypothetical protein